MSGPIIARLIGGAGTGKTTEMLSIMEKTLEAGVDPFRIGFVSFTRAARREASIRAADKFNLGAPEKLEQEGWFRTLHSVAYRCLGVKGDELITDTKASREWLKEALQEEVSGVQSSDEFTVEAAFEGNTSADVALQLWQAARNRLSPFEDVWHAAHECDERVPSYEKCVEIIERYEQAKRLDDRLDFTDLLCMFAGIRSTIHGAEKCEPDGEVPELGAVFLDEMQDASALLDRVAKRYIHRSQWAYIVGDPYQCQPAGTPVKTTKGYKPIETLDPNTDHIIAFNRKDGNFYGRGKQLPFQMANRFVDSSSIFEITMADGTVHRATDNHNWICRFPRTTWYATYLMRKGTRWRVGTVQMFANGESCIRAGHFRFNSRCHQEQADAGWILRAFETDREARAYEQVVSCRFGIPQVTFRPPTGVRTNLDAGFIEEVFNSLGDLTSNGNRCIAEHGLCVEFPFFIRGGKHFKNGDTLSRTIQTCNIIAGLMLLPKLNPDGFRDGRSDRRNGVHRTREMQSKRTVGSRVDWIKVVSVRRLLPGTPTQVFSLNVDTHHTYVTKEYVTCNCIYGFAGADANHFMSWEVAKQRIMPKSYRCPKEILDLGEAFLRQCSDYWDRGIAPADRVGEVQSTTLNEQLVKLIDPSQSWLLIARTNFQAKRMASLLDVQNIPWVPTKGNGGWDAPVRNTALGALLDLEEGCPIDGGQWTQVLKYLPSRIDGVDLLVRGTKKRFDDLNDAADRFPFVTPARLDELGATESLKQLLESRKWRRVVDHAERFTYAVERWGREVIANPPVRVGTIHSCKGSEADNVVLNTAISMPVMRSRMRTAGRDEENRVFYVGATRARNRLIVANDRRAPYSMKVPA